MLRLLVEKSVEEDLSELNLLTGLASFLKLFNDVFNYVLRGLVLGAVESLEQSLGPDDAVDQLLWPLSDGADWEALLFDTVSALIALCLPFLDGYTRSLVAIRTRLDKRDIQVEAHLVDVVPCLVVVKCIYHKVELAEEAEAKPVLLYFPNVVVNYDAAILRTDCFLQCLALGHIDVMSSEEELPVEVAYVDCIQVYD